MTHFRKHLILFFATCFASWFNRSVAWGHFGYLWPAVWAVKTYRLRSEHATNALMLDHGFLKHWHSEDPWNFMSQLPGKHSTRSFCQLKFVVKAADLSGRSAARTIVTNGIAPPIEALLLAGGRIGFPIKSALIVVASMSIQMSTGQLNQVNGQNLSKSGLRAKAWFKLCNSPMGLNEHIWCCVIFCGLYFCRLHLCWPTLQHLSLISTAFRSQLKQNCVCSLQSERRNMAEPRTCKLMAPLRRSQVLKRIFSTNLPPNGMPRIIDVPIEWLLMVLGQSMWHISPHPVAISQTSRLDLQGSHGDLPEQPRVTAKSRI